jgi:hypothetical protein
MQPIYSEARAFIESLHDHDTLTFQTASKVKGTIKPTFRHGTLDKHWDWLSEQNTQGANIYIMCNEGDGKGRRLRNVRAVTSVLVDLDGAPLDPVLATVLKPHVITETSSGRFQGIWRIQRIPVTRNSRYDLDNMYKRLHAGIAAKFDADPSIKALSHVCRLPGFINHNHHPFIARLFQTFPSPQLPMEELVDCLAVNLTQPTVQPYRPLTDGNGVLVDVTAGDPILKSLRNETLLRICSRLAYQDILGDDLVRDALAINVARCVPPLGEDEVIKLARKVTLHFAKFTDELILSKLRDRNTGLRVHAGHFYRYDPASGQYRMIELVALRNMIFRESHFTANDRRIKQVLEALADETRLCEDLDNPERRFIRERIVKGGKAVLRAVYGEYRSWCKPLRIRPATQAALRKEIEDLHPGTYRRYVRVGKTRHHGFLGLSIREPSPASKAIFSTQDYGSYP